MTTTPKSSLGRRRRAPRGEGERLKDEILDATQKLLLEAGDADAVSIRAVADRVGVTPPSIYLHFRDKEELIFAVGERSFARLDGVVAHATEDIDDPLESLAAGGRAYVRFGLDHPEEYRVVFMTPKRSQDDSFRPEQLMEVPAFTRLVESVEHAMRARAIASGDPLLAAVGLWAALHGITAVLITLPPLADEFVTELVEHTLAAHLRGLAAEFPGTMPPRN